ncbi:hypothetical protein LINPERPRIM_LOCUS24757 [Linum perenne]
MGNDEVQSEPIQVVNNSSDGGSESSYRGSENSDHIWGLVSDEDGPDDIYDAAPIYDPNCDHKHLHFVLGMKFISPTQFKHAVVNHAIYAGANLNWLRTGKARCEAVCHEEDCNWRIYCAWYCRNKSFMVQGLGDRHTCPRAQSINEATVKFIAIDFLKRFRINRD